jgi:hypothetical protein
MKRLRRYILPAVCFVTAWTGAHLASKTAAPVKSPGLISGAPRIRSAPSSSREAGRELASAFSTSRMAEWASLWEGFARNATADELENLPSLASPDRDPYYGSKGRDVLQWLAREELAVRTRKASATPGAYAALAESDPDAAWEQLRSNNYEALSCAVIRVLARRDPEDALRRLRALPAGIQREFDTGERSVFVASPVGSLFAAWARNDPAAALAEMKRSGSGGAAELVMTWAFHDSPAALRHIAESRPGGDPAKSLPMDVILRTAFHFAPAESAKLLSQYAELRRAMHGESCRLRALKSWFDADPNGVREWLRAERPNGDMWLTGRVVRSDPIAGAQLIREFPKAAFPDQSRNVASIAERDPALGAALADELGLRAQVEALLTSAAVRADPAAACDDWLEALREHGPDGALAVLGWTADIAREVAGTAVSAFPDKAKELAALVPASALATTDGGFRSAGLGRYWPELAPVPSPPPSPAASATDDFPAEPFALDPAAAAEALLSRTMHDWEAWNAVSLWAPHDFAAARSWLSRVPDGRARQLGELALAIEEAPGNPQGSLERFAFMPDELAGQLAQELARPVAAALLRLVVTGGDWRGWVGRLPPAIRERADHHFIVTTLERGLKEEEDLLAALRKSSAK